MILHVSRNPNPRLATAVARYLDAPARIVFGSPHGDPERFRRLNPTLQIPILEIPAEPPLWEADAIACRLSWETGSDFWRRGRDEAEMIRWLSWGKGAFVAACDAVHFERGTKRRYGLGPTDAAAVAAGLPGSTRPPRSCRRCWSASPGWAARRRPMPTFGSRRSCRSTMSLACLLRSGRRWRPGRSD